MTKLLCCCISWENQPVASQNIIKGHMSIIWTGDKPLPEPLLTQFADEYFRHLGTKSECSRTLHIRTPHVVTITLSIAATDDGPTKYLKTIRIAWDVQRYHRLLNRIESTKTTSMEDVSTGLIEKIKNI